jgi:riboflavin synthase
MVYGLPVEIGSCDLFFALSNNSLSSAQHSTILPFLIFSSYFRNELKHQIMFSGIVEEAAKVVKLEKDQENLHITMECSFAHELKIDQSLAHNGVCLTVVKKTDNTYTVTAIQETLMKSNLGLLQVGDKVNLERSLRLDSLLDGHLVQGHVDQTAVCKEVKEADGSWYYTFEYDPTLGNLTVEKGSISVNGVSLTVVNSRETSFQVAIIPYTWQVTNFHDIEQGTVVNLEFDIIGKYITKILKQQLGR